MSPGPDFVLISQQSVLGSRRNGLYAAAGIAMGLGVHSLYAMIGFAAIIRESQAIYSLIKYMGAAYLTYLGIQLLRSSRPAPAVAKQFATATDVVEREALSQHPSAARHAFFAGFLCNVLNPKASLFILCLFSQFANITNSIYKQIFVGAELICITFIWFAFLAIFLTHKSVAPKMLAFQSQLGVVMGILLITLAVKVALF